MAVAGSVDTQESRTIRDDGDRIPPSLDGDEAREMFMITERGARNKDKDRFQWMD